MRSREALALLVEGARRQRHILKALLIRDLMIRFQREGLGFAWLVLEPLSLILLVIVLWRVEYGESHNGIGVVPMVLTGYSFLTMWRHIVGRSHFAFRLSLDLKYHRKIQYGDILLSRFLLEVGGTFLAFWIAYLAFVLTDQIRPIDDLFVFCVAWLLMATFTTGVGFTLASINEIWEMSERFIPPLMYITLPMTGTFYMVSWLPQMAQDFVLWSPLVHAMEMLRAAYFGGEVVTYWDPYYLFACSIFMLATGLGLHEIAKTRVKALS